MDKNGENKNKAWIHFFFFPFSYGWIQLASMAWICSPHISVCSSLLLFQRQLSNVKWLLFLFQLLHLTVWVAIRAFWNIMKPVIIRVIALIYNKTFLSLIVTWLIEGKKHTHFPLCYISMQTKTCLFCMFLFFSIIQQFTDFLPHMKVWKYIFHTQTENKSMLSRMIT